MRIFLAVVLLASAVFPQHVLKFDRNAAQHVDHGQFFETSLAANPTPLPRDFAWEGWVKIDPTHTVGYVISAGYGGAHAVLLGFQGAGGKYAMTGNFWNGSDAACSSEAVFSFNSEAVFHSDVWYNIAVSSRNRVLTLYKNGVPIFSKTWTGERFASVCSQNDYSARGLYIGGSHHLNFSGSIAAVRGWEGYSPYDGSAYTPEISFRSDWTRDDGVIAYPVFLADYTQRGSIIADLSNGYNGKKHPGNLHSAVNGLGIGRPTQSGRSMPKWVEDPSYPLWSETMSLEPIGRAEPSNGAISDGFTRRENNMSDGGGLGQTETGHTWKTNARFGIQSERAVSLSNTFYGSALIDVENASHSVAVSRGGPQSETGLRVASKGFAIGYAVYTFENYLYFEKLDGVDAGRISISPIPGNWRRLRADVFDGIKIYVDDQLITVHGVTGAKRAGGGTKVGLYQFAPGIVQFDDFVVRLSAS